MIKVLHPITCIIGLRSILRKKVFSVKLGISLAWIVSSIKLHRLIFSAAKHCIVIVINIPCAIEILLITSLVLGVNISCVITRKLTCWIIGVSNIHCLIWVLISNSSRKLRSLIKLSRISPIRHISYATHSVHFVGIKVRHTLTHIGIIAALTLSGRSLQKTFVKRPCIFWNIACCLFYI